MNCSMPWSATEDLGKDVTPLVIHHRYVPCTLAEAERVLALEYERNPTKENFLTDERHTNWGDGDLIPLMMRHAYQKIHEQRVEKGVGRKWNDFVAHRMFPEVDKVRIPIPTGHILGEHDPFKELGTTMCDMCDPKVMLKYKHDFGHEIPSRSPRDLKRIKDVIEKTVIRSDFA
ncbi:MAG: hypothetical protein Q9161_006956 [Pseudevernia consocians]